MRGSISSLRGAALVTKRKRVSSPAVVTTPNSDWRPTSEALKLGAERLARALHEPLIAAIRKDYSPSWTDRGVRTGYLAEIDPKLQREMPAILIELAFFDNANDAAALRDPRFGGIAARALYRGLVDYFADDAAAEKPPLLPRPPASCTGRCRSSRSTCRSIGASLSFRRPAA